VTVFGKRDGQSLLHERASSLAERGPAAPPRPPGQRASAPRDLGAAVETIDFQRAKSLVQPLVEAQIPAAMAAAKPRGELAKAIEAIVTATAAEKNLRLNPSERRDLVTLFLQQRLELAKGQDPQESKASEAPAGTSLEKVVPLLYPLVMQRIDSEVASRLSRADLARQLTVIVADALTELKIRLNWREQRDLVSQLLNDMLGLGPLEPLLADETINDILVNGAKQIYVERHGKLQLTGATFRDNAHVMSIATRIVSAIGRRIDETTPMVDARLADGSRVNIIIPPLAIDGPTISIRKFSKKTLDLDVMARQKNISPAMATVLKIAARCQLNILISGGTGSGKTTLLNAMSKMIDHGERIVTIEDAAELQLQQPHVVRLETRLANLEGRGEINMGDLLKNALRMRPDRIILGEVRGVEAMDMLQAMNTGPDGSLGTIHANRPRDAFTRLENMIGMTGVNLPSRAVRTQIADALQMVVQIDRMRDGIRRVTSITEVVGMEGEVISTQELFTYTFQDEDAEGHLVGEFTCSQLRPHFMPRAQYFDLDRVLLEAVA
jgi:pilus assembly protein CpaF